MACCQETLGVDAIMAKVAENQGRAEKARTAYLYKQHIVVISRKTNGKLMCEEKTDYSVLPSESGVQKVQTRLEGRLWHKNNYVDYSQNAEDAKMVETAEQNGVVSAHDTISIQIPGGLLDGDLVRGFRDDIANDKTKDGIGKDLFPLTTEEQKDYQFELVGREERQGREVYRIRFRPKDRNDLTWAGEALIDAVEFAPMSVSTKLSRRIPFLVRTLLGTDVPGLGFSVTYKRVADGLWFPVSFGTEFRLHAVFFINRSVSVSLENSDFKRAEAESTIHYQTPPPTPSASGPPDPQ